MNHIRNPQAAVVIGAGMALLSLAGCTKHTIQIEPIHMTLDINLRVDRELDEFFDFEDEYETVGSAPTETAGPVAPPTTAPATQAGGAS